MRQAEDFGHRPAFFAVFISIVLLNSALTFNRSSFWLNEYILFFDAIDKSPRKARPHNVLAKAHMDSGDIDGAIEELGKAISLPSMASDFDEAIITSYLDLGRAYFKKKMFSKAIEKYVEVLRLYPITREYLDVMKMIYGQTTVEIITKLYSEIYDSLAMAYYETGDRTREMNAYLMSISLNPENDGAYTNLGVLYFEMGKREEAYRSLQRALQINPMNEVARRNLKNLSR